MALLQTYNDPKLCDLCIQFTCLTPSVTVDIENDNKKRKREEESEEYEITVLKEVYVSKAVLASQSDYFRHMFTSGFSESDKKTVCHNFSCFPSLMHDKKKQVQLQIEPGELPLYEKMMKTIYNGVPWYLGGKLIENFQLLLLLSKVCFPRSLILHMTLLLIVWCK